MRRSRRIGAALGLFLVAGITLASGCKDATQATLEVRMIKRDLCPSTGGTSLTVGVTAEETESRVSTFVTAETSTCDSASGDIGSLVITPGEAGRAAVVVIVAFDKSRAPNASSCKPPSYAGCVVARRFFAFSDHKNLRLPISIDPECLDVPCNATSTCRKGNCYSSEVIADGVEPGDDGSGGASEAGIVDGSVDGFVPDGSRPDGATDGSSGDGALDGTTDGASDAAADADGGGVTAKCVANVLSCPQAGSLVQCDGLSMKECCDDTCSNAGACVGKLRRCCINSDCADNDLCLGRSGDAPGVCQPMGSSPPTCTTVNGPLLCTAAACNGPANACCQEVGQDAVCVPGNNICPPMRIQWCCQTADCPGAKASTCPPPDVGNPTAARVCTGSK